MNRRQARAYVLRTLAAEVRHHIGNGSEWLYADNDGISVDHDAQFSLADQRRIIAEVEALADELERRARRMAEKLAPPDEAG